MQTLLALAMVYAKSGRRERCSQKNARLFAIIEAKLYGAPHQAKMRFRQLCSFRRPYAIRWISLILLLNPSVIPLV